MVVRAKGASGVSIAAIAEKAGIAQGSVYQYFPTKMAVLAAWEEREWSRISQEIGAEVAVLIGKRPPLQEAVRHLVRFSAARIAEQARVYSDADSGFPDFVSRATERKKILDMAVDVIAGALSAAPGGEVIRVRDSRRAAHVCVRLVMLLAPLAAAREFSPDARERTLADVEHLVMAFLFGHAPPSEKVEEAPPLQQPDDKPD